MTLIAGDKVVSVQTKTGIVVVPVGSLVPGGKIVTIQTTTGPVVVPVNPASVGDKCLMVPDKRGKYIAIKAAADITVINLGKRYGHEVVRLPNGNIVLMGGVVHEIGYKNDVVTSSSYGSSWTVTVEHAPWSARAEFASAVLSDGTIIITGGVDGTNLLADVWKSVDSGATWTQVTASAGWGSRSMHRMVALSDDTLILIGGYTGAYDPVYYARGDVWKSEDAGATWTRVVEWAEWPPREACCAVVLSDDRIVINGGLCDKQGGLSYLLKDTWTSIDHGATWTQRADAGSGLQGIGWNQNAMAADRNDRIVLYEGHYVSGPPLHGVGSVWVSTNGGISWTEADPDADPGCRSSSAGGAGVFNNLNRFIIICGVDPHTNPAIFYDTVWISNTALTTWNQVHP